MKHTKTAKTGIQILPISSFLAIIGSFFTIASIVYVITKLLCHTSKIRIIVFSIETAILYVGILLTFFVIGIKNYKKSSEIESYNNSLICLNCIRARMEDGFHNQGLLHLDELIAYERKLSSSNDPCSCKVLVYTSDLATEKNAEFEVKNNIKSGVQYIVLYFTNSCKKEEYSKIKDLYGEKNLVNLAEREEFRVSFDGQLAVTLGFDIMVYKNEKNEISGFFAVDFIPEDKPYRKCHDPNCTDRCNYGKENPIPFYKVLSFEIAKQLFDEGIKLQKDASGE